MAIVLFHQADRQLSLGKRLQVKEFIKEIFSAEGVSLDRLDYIFCSDEYLLQLNKAHLNHDYYTDILTFDLSSGAAVVGEIYVSVDRVKDNALKISSLYTNELLRVIFHGALHLCGYRDKTKREITIMREREDYYLRLFEQKRLDG